MILSKALTSPSKVRIIIVSLWCMCDMIPSVEVNSLTYNQQVVRFLATRHMRVLLRAGVANFSAWGVEFLVKQVQPAVPTFVSPSCS